MATSERSRLFADDRSRSRTASLVGLTSEALDG